MNAPAPARDTKGGVRPGVPYEAYARWPGLRSSYLRRFARSPLHARTYALWPEAPTQAMNLGTAIHTAVLEPDRLEVQFVAGLGIDRRSNANKAAWAEYEAENAGKGILDAQEWATVHAIRDAVWSQPWAEALLGGKGATELSVMWEDAESGAPCKARIDRFAADFVGVPTVVDLKSTRDASKRAFAHDVELYDYALQAAFYLDGLAANADRQRQWYWIAVEKTRPYGVALYHPGPATLAEGRAQYKAAIAAHVEAERTDIWRGYPETAQEIELAPWARRLTRDSLAEMGL